MSRLFRTNHRGTHEVEEATERIRIGETRRVHIVGDQVIESVPVREAEQEAPAASSPELQHVREATQERPPAVSLPGPDGKPVNVILDAAQRLPAFEAFALGFSGRPVKVWRFANYAMPDVAGVAQAGAVFLNAVSRTWRCPVQRLAVLAHELRHIERGDRGGPVDPDAEAECESAAAETIAATIAGVDRKTPSMTGASTDPRVCQECYRTGAKVCRQSESTLARVLEALKVFVS